MATGGWEDYSPINDDEWGDIMCGETESLRKLVPSNIGLKRESFPSLSDK